MNALFAMPRWCSRSLAALAAMSRRFGRDRSGATALEFGLIGIPFFSLILVMFEVSMLFLEGQALDTTLDSAARQLLTGTAQTSSGSTAITDMATFKTYAFCPLLPAIITCSQVQLNVAVITSWSSASLGPPISNGTLNTSSWGYSPCQSNPSNPSIMKVEAAYPVSALSAYWNPATTVTLNGTKDRVLYSSTVFRCEPF